MAHPAIASLGAGASSVVSSSARVARRQRAPVRVSGSASDRRAARVGESERARQRRGRGIEAVAASTGVKVDRFGASVAADFPPRFERPSSPSCSVGLELEEDFLDARDDAPDENEVTTTRQCLDSRKVALGSLALFVLVGGVAAIHPDPALAREVTLELPDFDIPDFEVPDIPTTPMEFLEVVTTNPYAAVAASVAAYLVIPKAAELLVKYVLVPALVLLVAYEASQNPDETIALVASAINQARDHPTVTSGIILAILALVLSPYILVAAGVGLIVSGVQLLPEQLKPVLPAPVREIETQIEELHRAVDPGVHRAVKLLDLGLNLPHRRRQHGLELFGEQLHARHDQPDARGDEDVRRQHQRQDREDDPRGDRGVIPRLVNRRCDERDGLIRVLRSLVSDQQHECGNQHVLHQQLRGFGYDKVRRDGRRDGGVRVRGDDLEELHWRRGNVRDFKVGDVEVRQLQGDLPGERGIGVDRGDATDENEERERAEGDLAGVQALTRRGHFVLVGGVVACVEEILLELEADGTRRARRSLEARREIGRDGRAEAVDLHARRRRDGLDASPSPLARALRFPDARCATIGGGPAHTNRRALPTSDPRGARDDRRGPRAEARDGGVRHRSETLRPSADVPSKVSSARPSAILRATQRTRDAMRLAENR